MKSSPIYNIVDNPGRKSDASFGSSTGYSMDIRVGTSAINSHTLGEVAVRYFDLNDGRREFVLYLDGFPIKKGILDGKEFDLKTISS